MTNTPRLALPRVGTAQVRKHISYNRAVRTLDAIVQLSVNDRGRTAPPALPASGDQYIIGIGATGAWSGRDNHIAAFQGEDWNFYSPGPGWRCFVINENRLVYWDGNVWSEFADGSGSGSPSGDINGGNF